MVSFADQEWSLSRHGIVAAAAPRVTAQQSSRGEPAAAGGAVTTDRLGSILRACRRVAARGRQKRRNACPVTADHQEERAREHRFSVQLTISSRSSPYGTPYASRRARTSTSDATPASESRGSTSRRRTSRRRRLTRFRSTIVCLYFGTITPTRGCGTGEGESKTSRWAVPLLFPRLRISRM